MVLAKTIRVQMVTTKSEEVSPGSIVIYNAGDFYLLPVKLAEKWIAAGEAIDPDNPQQPPQEEPQAAEEGGDS